MKYERPDLEELELELEGSFLATQSRPGDLGVDVGGDENDGDEWD